MSTSAGHADARYDRPYRDMATFARVTQWLLYASAAVSAAGFYFSGLGGDGSTLVASAPSGPVEAVVGLLELPLWIANVVTVLRWTYVANANARALGATDLTVTPLMSILWYFIPLANLWMPLQAMREIWKGSVKPHDWETVGTPAPLIFWWLFWLAAGISATIALPMMLEAASRQPFDPEGATTLLLGAEGLFAISNLLMIPAALLLAMIIGRVEALQAAHRGSAEAFA